MLIKDQDGSIMVEMGLIGPVFCGFVIFLLVVGLWLYNATVASQAARHAAYRLAVSGSYDQAIRDAKNYFHKAAIGASLKDVYVSCSGDNAYSRVDAEMKTFSGMVNISKEAVTVVERRYRYKEQYNW